MTTEITYIHRGRRYNEKVNCLNPSNAPAILFQRKPYLDRLDTTIINCIGYVKFQRPNSHFHPAPKQDAFL